MSPKEVSSKAALKYMDQQKYDAAAIQFKKAIQIDPNLPRLTISLPKRT